MDFGKVRFQGVVWIGVAQITVIHSAVTREHSNN
jgi:hypothetical protein